MIRDFIFNILFLWALPFHAFLHYRTVKKIQMRFKERILPSGYFEVFANDWGEWVREQLYLIEEIKNEYAQKLKNK